MLDVHGNQDIAMYSRIVVPVALAHTDKLEKALATAADLGQHYGAKLHMVGVTSPAPDEVSHNAEEFRDKLDAFAAEQSKARGVEFQAHTIVTADPAVELDKRLDEYIHDIGADLVVMASHVPGFREYVFASNAGFLAAHTDISVLVVR